MHLKSIFLLLLASITTSHVFAQGAEGDASKEKTRNIKTVTVTLPGGFTGATGNSMPFDESFNLSGSAAGIERLELAYRISPFQGKRDFWFRVCPIAEKGDYKIPPLRGSEKIVTEDEKDGYYFIKITSKGIKPTEKTHLPVGLTLKIAANKVNPITKLVETADKDQVLYFDGYQLVDDKNIGQMEAAIISPQFYFPALRDIGPDGYLKEPIAWEKNGDTFLLNVGPLHANVKYDFRFTIYTRPDLNDTDKDKLIAEIASMVKKEYQLSTINNQSGARNLRFDTLLAATVARSFNKGGELVDANKNHFTLNHQTPAVKLLTTEMLNAGVRADQIKGYVKSIETDLIDDQKPLLTTGFYTVDIQKEISNIADASIFILPKPTKDIWEATITGTKIPPKVIGAILIEKDKLEKIILGTLKIDPDGTTSSSATGVPDRQSIVYLYKFFETLDAVDFNVKNVNNKKTIQLFKTTGFGKFYTFFKQTLAAIDTKNKKLIGKVTDLGTTTGLLNDTQSKIKTDLDQIVRNIPKKMSPSTTALLDMPLNPGISAYKSIKVSDAAMLVYTCFSNPNYFKSLLDGTGEIDTTGKFVQSSEKTQISIPSIKVLISFFRLINSPAFTDPKGDRLFAAREDDLDYLIFKLETFAAEVSSVQAVQTDVASFQTAISNQIAAAFVKQSYFISGSSIINMDVEAEKNPYVGVDFGMGYAFGPKAVFINEGINIYFRPINRDVPISTFYGWDRFLKTFSIFLGISQTLSDNASDNGYQSLFDGDFKSNLLFGAGLRINSLMRINVGGLIYRQGDPNPLITKTKVNVSPTVSFAIDLTVAKLFKSIGELFK